MNRLKVRLKVLTLLSRYQRLVKFCLVGASGTVVNLGVLYLLTDMIGLHYLVSNVAAFICSVTNNFAWNSLWTFNDKKMHTIGYFKYTGTSLLGLGVNETVLWLLTAFAGLWYMLSATVAIVAALLVNYTLSKHLVWTKDKEKMTPETDTTQKVYEIPQNIENQ